MEFEERWGDFCECGIGSVNPELNSPKNPYLEGSLGNWRAKRSRPGAGTQTAS